MIEKWLTQKTTVAEAEAKYLLGANQSGQNSRWEELKAQMTDGDELWEYSSPPET